MTSQCARWRLKSPASPLFTQQKHQSSASLAFVMGIHRCPVNSPHKGPVTRKMFPLDDVIMIIAWHCRKWMGRLRTAFHILPVHVSLTELDFTVRVNINFYVIWNSIKAWWRHQMEIFSTLMVLCAGNSPVTGEFFAQRPVMRSFDVFFELHQNKQLSKQSWCWWFETPSCPLWRQCNDICSQGICNYSTLWNRMTHICVGNLGHHWFR